MEMCAELQPHFVTQPTAHTGADHTGLPKHGIISERTGQPFGTEKVNMVGNRLQAGTVRDRWLLVK